MGNRRHRKWASTALLSYALLALASCTSTEKTSEPHTPGLAPAVQIMPQSSITGRYDSQAIWTGTEMIIWGGAASNRRSFIPNQDKTEAIDPIATPLTESTWYADGASYSPDTGRWVTLPASPLSARSHHQAVWTGSEVLLWGGVTSYAAEQGLYAVSSAAQYSPETKKWQVLPAAPEGGLSGAKSVFLDGYMITVAGFTESGAPNHDIWLYDIAQKIWSTVKTEQPARDIAVAGNRVFVAHSDQQGISLQTITASGEKVAHRKIPRALDKAAPSRVAIASSDTQVVIAELPQNSLDIDVHKIALNESYYPAEYTYLKGAGSRPHPRPWFGTRAEVHQLIQDQHLLLAANHQPMVLPLNPQAESNSLGVATDLASCDASAAYAWGKDRFFSWGGRDCKGPEAVNIGLQWNFKP